VLSFGGTQVMASVLNHQWQSAMSDDPTTNRSAELRTLAALAESAAEKTSDPNRKRALRALALKYRRLAYFVRNGSVVHGD
jgi:hypothetical protein